MAIKAIVGLLTAVLLVHISAASTGAKPEKADKDRRIGLQPSQPVPLQAGFLPYGSQPIGFGAPIDLGPIGFPTTTLGDQTFGGFPSAPFVGNPVLGGQLLGSQIYGGQFPGGLISGGQFPGLISRGQFPELISGGQFSGLISGGQFPGLISGGQWIGGSSLPWTIPEPLNLFPGQGIIGGGQRKTGGGITPGAGAGPEASLFKPGGIVGDIIPGAGAGPEASIFKPGGGGGLKPGEGAGPEASAFKAGSAGATGGLIPGGPQAKFLFPGGQTGGLDLGAFNPIFPSFPVSKSGSPGSLTSYLGSPTTFAGFNPTTGARSVGSYAPISGTLPSGQQLRGFSYTYGVQNP